ncbi:contact-dependent growth inhibition system immunity protein [Streptomyces desertarenae]|uniref:Contact-dependent growth inhibition system immunity protein n=1 Tax=Streptomyces desertarenae TaxID=2666184 RepID=A0ABW4PJQ1_9ACTN
MKILGFYEEFWPTSAGTPDGSIREFLADDPGVLEEEAADYLRGGREVFASMGVTEDILGSGEIILGGGSVHTDGEWIWRGDLGFYLLKYHLRLPGDFVDKIRTAVSHTLAVGDGKLVELTYEVMRILSSPRRTVPPSQTEPVDWKARFPAVHRLLGAHLSQAFPHRYSSRREAIDDYITAAEREERRQLVDEMRTLLRPAGTDDRLAEAAEALGLAIEPPTGVAQRQWFRDIADIVARVSA